MPDPIDDARALLVLARLIFRARHNAAIYGVQTAPAAACALAGLGRRLRAAVDEAERAEAGSPERQAALSDVDRIGAELWAEVDERWEGIRGLVSVALDGVRDRKAKRPGVA